MERPKILPHEEHKRLTERGSGSLQPACSAGPDKSEYSKTRKILCLTVSRRDWALLETMLYNGQEKLPDLEMDGMISALVAEVCRCHREHNSQND